MFEQRHAIVTSVFDIILFWPKCSSPTVLVYVRSAIRLLPYTDVLSLRPRTKLVERDVIMSSQSSTVSTLDSKYLPALIRIHFSQPLRITYTYNTQSCTRSKRSIAFRIREKVCVQRIRLTSGRPKGVSMKSKLGNAMGKTKRTNTTELV